MALPKLAFSRATIPPDTYANYFGRFLARGNEVLAAGGAYGSETLLRSTDGGHVFEALNTPTVLPRGSTEKAGLRDMYVDGKTIWVGGEKGVVAYTNNDGKRWKSVKIDSKCVYTIEPDPEGRLWIGGENGMLYRATKKHGPFEPVRHATNQNVFAIYFDPKDGKPWLAGISHLQRFDGEAFETVKLRAKPSIAQLVRLPSGTLVAVGREGVILRSTNNGRSWKPIPTDVKTNFEALAYTPYGLFIVGDKLHVSNDDGQTFAVVEGDFSAHIWAIGFVAGALLLGGTDAIFRIASSELAKLLHAAYADRDDMLAALAQRVEACDDGAELVLEDALRERTLW